MSKLHAAAPGDIEAGMDVLRDAVALIRVVAAGDGEGVHAVMSGTDAPRHVACAVAVFAYFVCRRGGLDEAGIDQLVGEFSGVAVDSILDQPQLWAGGEAA